MQYAIFRWENAVIAGGAILLTAFWATPFPWWPVWGWPVLGLLGMAAVTLSSLTNPRTNAELLLKAFQAQFDLSLIKIADLRRKMDLALEYQRRIESQVRQPHGSVLWDRPEDTANQLEDWISNVYRLAVRVDSYRRDALLKQEMESAPKQIESLNYQRKRETNPIFQHELDHVIESRQKHWQAMQALDTRIRQAEYQLEQSLAALATVDSQVQLIEAEDSDGGRSERIRGDIKEQVNRLNDLVASINEVYEIPTPSGGGGLKAA